VSGDALFHLRNIMLWGLVATVGMTTILQGSQGLGLSRLSLPFLLGTLFTADRRRANIVGFALYTLGGWAFAALYYLLFVTLDKVASWWLGAAFGGLHGLFLLAVVLPMLPSVHPRMASEHDGPTARRRIEPPGFLGLNYGRRTAVTTLLGQLVYGAILGAAYSLHLGMQE
jgi:uncharacterized membrane protein YagU involved in acid resistance